MARHFRTTIVVASVTVLVAACSSQAPEANTGDSATAARSADGVPYAYKRLPLDTSHQPGTVIDSSFPMPEMIRRFRAGLPVPAELKDGAPSRQELITRFVTALAAADRAALVKLNMTRAEFAYLYFPNSRDAAMPNGMPPALRWELISLNSEKGIGRALDRVGNRKLTLESFDCPNPPVTTGTVTMHDGCTVRLGLPDGQSFNGRLFGSIMSVGGRFKFVGYANDM